MPSTPPGRLGALADVGSRRLERQQGLDLARKKSFGSNWFRKSLPIERFFSTRDRSTRTLVRPVFDCPQGGACHWRGCAPLANPFASTQPRLLPRDMTDLRVAWPWPSPRSTRPTTSGPAVDRVRVRVVLGTEVCHDRSFALPARVSLGPGGTFALRLAGDDLQANGGEVPLLVPVGTGVGLHLGGARSELAGWLLAPGSAPWSLAELRAEANVLLRAPVVPLTRGMAVRLFYGVWRLDIDLEPARPDVVPPRPAGPSSRRAALGVAVGCVVTAVLALVPAPQTPSVLANAARQRAGLAASEPASLSEPAQRLAAAAAIWRSPKGAQPELAAARAPREVVAASPQPVVLDVQPAAVLGARPGSVLATSVPVWRAFGPAPAPAAGAAQSTLSSMPSRAANTNNGLPNLPAR